MDGRVRRVARFEIELAHQRVQPQTRHVATDADAQRPVLVMAAHRDHRAIEARVADARHGEQDLAGEKAGIVHGRRLTAHPPVGKPPRLGEPRAQF